MASRIASRFVQRRFSSSGKMLSEEEKAAENVYIKKWVKHFREKFICYGINSHNKDDIKGLLNLVRTRIREVKGYDGNYTATVLLTGMPNVGKSAIDNSMHQIGRISAAEKGKLKHAVVSPQPGETKDITSYKIASHPNIYILDTPGVLYPEIAHDDYGSKLALTGTVKDSLLGECKLAQYFLAVLNCSEEFKHWENLKYVISYRSFSVNKEKCLLGSDSIRKRRRHCSSDHTQSFGNRFLQMSHIVLYLLMLEINYTIHVSTLGTYYPVDYLTFLRKQHLLMLTSSWSHLSSVTDHFVLLVINLLPMEAFLTLCAKYQPLACPLFDSISGTTRMRI